MNETTDNAAPAAIEAAAPAIPDIFNASGESLSELAAESEKADPAQEPAPDNAETQAASETDWQAEAQTLKEQLAGLQKDLHAAKSDSGRIAAYQKQIDELKANLEKPPPTEQGKPAFLDDYPDIETYVQKRIDDAFDSRDKAARQQSEQALAEQSAFVQELSAQIPDWQTQWNSEPFQEWFKVQSAPVQEWANGSRADQAIELFKMFAGTKPPAQKTRDDTLAAVASTTKGTQTAAGETPAIDEDDWDAVDDPKSPWYSPRLVGNVRR